MREFVQSRPADIKHPIKQKPKTALRRLHQVGATVNVRIDMTYHQFDSAFREFFNHQVGTPNYRLSKDLLLETRRALNIHLQRGRPAGNSRIS